MIKNKKKILVTGGDGRFAKILKSKNSKLNLHFASKKECNILNKKSILRIIKKIKPSIVLHTAALSRPMDIHENNIEEKLFYSIFNQCKQLENYILINSIKSLKEYSFKLKDLQSRINSLVYIGIDLPTDELLQVIITKSFSDKQVSLNPKISQFIINNVERSYDKMFKFLKDIDELSLSTGKSININLIKKVLGNE